MPGFYSLNYLGKVKDFLVSFYEMHFCTNFLQYFVLKILVCTITCVGFS